MSIRPNKAYILYEDTLLNGTHYITTAYNFGIQCIGQYLKFKITANFRIRPQRHRCLRFTETALTSLK